MTTQHCQVTGTVTYREGDGIDMPVPLGPCEIEVTKLDATLSWQDGDSRGAAAIPLPDYSRYVSMGALVVEERR